MLSARSGYTLRLLAFVAEIRKNLDPNGTFNSIYWDEVQKEFTYHKQRRVVHNGMRFDYTNEFIMRVEPNASKKELIRQIQTAIEDAYDAGILKD